MKHHLAHGPLSSARWRRMAAVELKGPKHCATIREWLRNIWTPLLTDPTSQHPLYALTLCGGAYIQHSVQLPVRDALHRNFHLPHTKRRSVGDGLEYGLELEYVMKVEVESRE